MGNSTHWKRLRAERSGASDWAARLATRLLWLCPILAAVVAGLLFWLFGLSFWTAAAAGLLLGCPIAVVMSWWVDHLDQRQRRDSEQ